MGYHNGVVLGGDEAHEEDVSASAIVALDDGFSQGRVRVEGNVLICGYGISRIYVCMYVCMYVSTVYIYFGSML